MAHIYPDYQTKKAFKEAVKAGVKVNVVNTSPFFPMAKSGRTSIEAPAFYHKWYATVEYKNMVVTKVLG